MPSSEKFRDHVLQQFKGELRVTTRKMMGESSSMLTGKSSAGFTMTACW
nr:hypothetical protein [Fibrobacter sp. UBA4309]